MARTKYECSKCDNELNPVYERKDGKFVRIKLPKSICMPSAWQRDLDNFKERMERYEKRKIELEEDSTGYYYNFKPSEPKDDEYCCSFCPVCKTISWHWY